MKDYLVSKYLSLLGCNWRWWLVTRSMTPPKPSPQNESRDRHISSWVAYWWNLKCVRDGQFLTCLILFDMEVDTTWQTLYTNRSSNFTIHSFFTPLICKNQEMKWLGIASMMRRIVLIKLQRILFIKLLKCVRVCLLACNMQTGSSA